jgi:hypothetical protein
MRFRALVAMTISRDWGDGLVLICQFSTTAGRHSQTTVFALVNGLEVGSAVGWGGSGG